ncbi:MAG: preprotein translocase subunit SecY [Chitinophagaceae bacterium]|nr:preprotein translocase subunit SecY [Chitinophagaceae bacterium]MBK7679188.1 preprotein translocase subunit SecY [Chitinophagaceae bacterium]MBK8299471.1 preprotein translocase subunit SecY [Chitinophagaceae bacterium]MBK9463521.1 preprotein translocase subunit SecY [Chitinophagaceae bacterium]MBK9659361.1 preprotein translocase subunit SecY [Chitinophagaceae bacterium]
MKKLIQTLKNIWSIEELRGKILFTLMMIAIYRLGSHIVLPGIDPTELKTGESSNGILGLIDAFSGGAFNNASIFALGIMPYISASIFMQLMTVLVPRFQKMQKEGDSGRKKITQYTRYLTVAVTVLQASAYVKYLEGLTAQGGMMAGFSPGNFWLTTVVVLTAGTLFVMWMGEKITDKGLGNGTSLIIMIGILARLPQSFLQELSAKSVRSGDILVFIVEIAILIAIIMGCILLIQGVRKVPVNYAKQIVGNRQFGGARQFLPLKVNSAGVMPIIFAQAIIFIPTIFASYNPSGVLKALTDHSNVLYMVVYSVVVIGFTFLYTALIFNPKQIADNLKQNNGFIPGVKPGQPTADYIGSIMDKITLPGAILLAFVGILPGIAQRFGVTQQFSTFFGGTSLLIMVGVILDTLQQIETQLLMRQYDGLMKSGRIQGRQTTSAVQM